MVEPEQQWSIHSENQEVVKRSKFTWRRRFGVGTGKKRGLWVAGDSNSVGGVNTESLHADRVYCVISAFPVARSHTGKKSGLAKIERRSSHQLPESSTGYEAQKHPHPDMSCMGGKNRAMLFSGQYS